MLAPVLLSAVLAAGAQAPPSPAPRAEPPDRPVPRIGVSAELVELDVIVTDGKDHPLTDLGPEDFEVLEEGRSQPITHFARAISASPATAAPAAPAGSEASFPDAGPRARHVVLLVDDYHLEPADLSSVQAALRRFVDTQLAAGDEAVVVAASGSLGALQQFTADRDVLRRAVARLRVQNRSFRPPLDVPRMTDYQAELIESGDGEALDLAAKEIMAAEPAPPGSTRAVQAQTMAQTCAPGPGPPDRVHELPGHRSHPVVTGAARAQPPPPWPQGRGLSPAASSWARNASRAGATCRRRGRAVRSGVTLY